ncbi:MAG: hypothetical protein ACI8PZ_001478 [Myxococcota bacterium]|jgi:hypothetical protein
MRGLFLVSVLIGCGGKGDADTAPVVDNTACRDGWASEPLNTVPADAWPEGLASSIPLLEELDGLWRAVECDDADEVVDLKIVVPPQDAVEVYTTPPATNVACGCDTDPAFTTDNAYVPVARVTIDVFVEDYAGYALNDQNFEIPLIFYRDGQALKARACQRIRIDPDLDDQWTYGTIIIRLEAGNVLSGSLVLENGGTTEQCSLTEWEGR